VDLEFGILTHSCRERYYHARASGADHEQALDTALDWLLCATWDTRLSRPWTTDDVNKNRLTLVRTMVWYLDQYAADPLETIILANGKPAVELSFRYATTYRTRAGEPFELAGHLDRLVRLAGTGYLSDLKTTKHTIDARYRAQFTPDNQFFLYEYSVPIVWSVDIAGGILVDAIQVAVSFSRPERFMVMHSKAQLAEWYDGLELWLSHAEDFARCAHWPMNERACFLCEYRGICSRSPQSRDQWLAADFERRVWDPTKARGDI
jgi:hypothetical protein